MTIEAYTLKAQGRGPKEKKRDPLNHHLVSEGRVIAKGTKTSLRKLAELFDEGEILNKKEFEEWQKKNNQIPSQES